MSKQKHAMLLSLLTLVLCIGVMVTGIYAAQTAVLNMSGQLGFSMHDAIVDVSGTIENVADGDNAVTKTIDRVIKGPSGSSTDTVTNNLDLGDLYFYKGRDMIFMFTFKNISTGGFQATISINIPTSSNIAQVLSDGYDKLPTTKILLAGKKNTVKFALRLTDESSQLSLADFTITIGLESTTITNVKVDSEDNIISVKKFADLGHPDNPTDSTKTYVDYVKEITIDKVSGVTLSDEGQTYATKFPYYVELGSTKDTKTKLKWLIIGYYGELYSDDTACSIVSKLVDGSDAKNALQNGYMLSDVAYVLLSEKALKTGQSFLKASNYTSIEDQYADDGYLYVNTKSAYSSYNVNANDYYTSDIREYLRNSLTNDYIFTNAEINLISARGTKELEIIDGAEDMGGEGKLAIDVQDLKNEMVDISDKFWLLGLGELHTILDAEKASNDTWYNKGASLTVSQADDTATVIWWLRTVYNNDSGKSRIVNNNSDVYATHYVHYENAVRPACII